MIPAQTRCRDEELVGSESAPATSTTVVRAAQTWAHDNLVPLNASIETTLACNIRCVHCYNFDRDQPLRPQRAGGAAAAGPQDRQDAAGTDGCGTARPELSTAEILRVMGELRQAGCLFLSLTGGEVLSHPDLFQFLERARELNLAVQLLTNGTLLRPGMAKRLAGYSNLLGASVSLYGASAAVHDGITQVTGSFARTWAGVERLRAAGVAVRLKFIIMRQNAHETAGMRQAADARRFPYIIDTTVTARHDGTSGSVDARMGRAELEALARGPLRDLLPIRPRPMPPASQFTCNCARGNCAISATGDVYPCVSVPWSAGNVRERPFIEIWKHSPVFQRIRGLTLNDFSRCAPCPHRAYCTHDRGAAFTATGDYTGADPFVCATAEITHQIVDESAAQAGAAPQGETAAPAVVTTAATTAG